MTNVIYVGKSTGAVMKNQLFTSRPTELIAELEKTNPGIGAKFISVDEYAGAIAKASSVIEFVGTTDKATPVATEKKGGKDNA